MQRLLLTVCHEPVAGLESPPKLFVAFRPPLVCGCASHTPPGRRRPPRPLPPERRQRRRARPLGESPAGWRMCRRPPPTSPRWRRWRRLRSKWGAGGRLRRQPRRLRCLPGMVGGKDTPALGRTRWGVRWGRALPVCWSLLFARWSCKVVLWWTLGWLECLLVHAGMLGEMRFRSCFAIGDVRPFDCWLGVCVFSLVGRACRFLSLTTVFICLCSHRPFLSNVPAHSCSVIVQAR